MARKKDGNKGSYFPKGPIVKEETKHGILAVILFALALFFILARFDYAGLAGRTTYDLLGKLFGIGFLFIPLTLFILGVSFLRSVFSVLSLEPFH